MTHLQDKPTDGQWQQVLERKGLFCRALKMCGVPRRHWDEMFSDVGHDALLAALRCFDPANGAAFTTYAMPGLLERIHAWQAQQARHLSIGRILPDARNEQEQFEAKHDAPIYLSCLSDSAREIVELRFYKGLTEEAIGERVGVTHQRVSQVLAESLAKMRKEALRHG